MGNDNTVRRRGRALQIPPSRLRPHFIRAKLRLNEYSDSIVALFWGPHRIAEFPAEAADPSITTRAA